MIHMLRFLLQLLFYSAELWSVLIMVLHQHCLQTLQKKLFDRALPTHSAVVHGERQSSHVVEFRQCAF